MKWQWQQSKQATACLENNPTDPIEVQMQAKH